MKFEENTGVAPNTLYVNCQDILSKMMTVMDMRIIVVTDLKEGTRVMRCNPNFVVSDTEIYNGVLFN